MNHGQNPRRLAAISLAATAVIWAFASTAFSADDGIQLLGVAELPGTALDKSGLQNTLEDGTPHGRVGGLSAIEYSDSGDTCYVLSDRGPKDGTVRFNCRFQQIELTLPQGNDKHCSARVVGTTFFKASDGKSYIR